MKKDTIGMTTMHKNTFVRRCTTAVLMPVYLCAIGPVATLASAVRSDRPPVSATIDSVADQKGDGGLPQAIYVTFRNDASVDADDVRFVARRGQDVIALTDHGRFANGVDIVHRFSHPNASFGSSWQTARIEVSYVHFVDGSTWTRGEHVQARTRIS